ncbi:hypothetical protein VTJ04DRAFT_2667 [Mycothermus thermophilus]|uniref:uncharacterized protein n=1 Tax=Humicola insolens TaxID=85995 RepID=UPI0037431D16
MGRPTLVQFSSQDRKQPPLNPHYAPRPRTHRTRSIIIIIVLTSPSPLTSTHLPIILTTLYRKVRPNQPP